MTIELSFSELQKAIADLKHNVNHQLRLDANETVMSLPPALGNGHLRGISLQDGLDLCVQDFISHQDIRLNSENLSLQEAYVSLTFCMTGTFKGSLTDVYSDRMVRAQDAVFCANPHAEGTVEYGAGEHVRFVGINLDPALMLSLLEQELAELPQNFQKAIQSGASQPLMHFCDTSIEMAQVLHQIIYCPYHSRVRSVYLEGKTLELTALYFSQFYRASNLLPFTPLRRQDIARIYEGREILRRNLMTPPSLAELSNQVGLSERKLQRGFKELFGTTVFGVLHNERMDHARQLLEHKQMTIGAIADMVGFAHHGYFARAFKRKFGCTPREYAKQLNNTRDGLS
ncbi:MAG: AraC family transcriptional regulator [Cyanobacteria bacterium P01_F01_bin.150]